MFEYRKAMQDIAAADGDGVRLVEFETFCFCRIFATLFLNKPCKTSDFWQKWNRSGLKMGITQIKQEVFTVGR